MILTLSIVTSISLKEFNSIPVAVIIISASIFLPESNLIPSDSNSLIVSVTTEALLFLIENAIKSGVSIVIDANWREIFWNYSNKSSPLQRIDHVLKIKKFFLNGDILKLSNEEAILFFENDNPLLISQSLPKKPDVIITNGDKPISWLINGIKGTTQILKSSKIVDTTGAGDSFLAGLVSRFLFRKEDADKKCLNNHLQFASTCGLISCLGQGAIEPQPNIEKVQDFLKSYGS